MRPSTLALVTLLLVAALPAAPADSSPLSPEVERLVRSVAAERGVPFDPDAMVAQRETRTADGRTLVQTVGREEWMPLLEALLSRAPAVTPATPDVAVGGLSHAMLQIGRCDGYADEEVLPGVVSVTGSWDLGMHSAPGPLGGGVGLDLADPQAALGASVHDDTSVRAVGQLAIEETYLRFFGVCIGTVGQMAGPGTFWFQPAV